MQAEDPGTAQHLLPMQAGGSQCKHTKLMQPPMTLQPSLPVRASRNQSNIFLRWELMMAKGSERY